MRKNIMLAGALAIAAALICYGLYRLGTPAAVPVDAPLSDLVVFPLGNDARHIGQLAEPVNGRAFVYDANASGSELRAVTVAPGTWLVPESMLEKPD